MNTKYITDTSDKIQALANFLEVDIEDITEVRDEYQHGNQSYLVLTDDEANTKALEYTKSVFEDCYISEIEKNLGGGWFASKVMELINDHLDDFAQEAIDSDGRANSLATYDSEENLESVNGIDYYIYRTN